MLLNTRYSLVWERSTHFYNRLHASILARTQTHLHIKTTHPHSCAHTHLYKRLDTPIYARMHKLTLGRLQMYEILSRFWLRLKFEEKSSTYSNKENQLLNTLIHTNCHFLLLRLNEKKKTSQLIETRNNTH